MKLQTFIAGFLIMLLCMITVRPGFASPGDDKAPVQKESVYKPVVNDVVASVATFDVLKTFLVKPEVSKLASTYNLNALKIEASPGLNSVPIVSHLNDTGTLLHRIRSAVHNRRWQLNKRSNKILYYRAEPDRVVRLV